MAQITPADMEAHVVALGEEHGIEVEIVDVKKCFAVRKREDGPYIRTRPIRSQVTYLIALHELGHHLAPEQKERRIIQEVAAWEWAIDQARCKLTSATKKRIGKYLRSYVTRYTSGYGYGAKQAWLPSKQDRPDVLKRLERLIEGRYRQGGNRV